MLQRNENASSTQGLKSLVSLAALEPHPGDLYSLQAGIVLEALEPLTEPIAPEKLRRIIENRFKIQMGLESLVKTIGRLFDENKVAQHKDQRIFLLDSVKQQLKRQGNDLIEVRDRLIRDWLDEIETTDRELEALERLNLAEDLETYLISMVRYHGTEVTAFLYAEADKPKKDLLLDTKKVLGELPKRTDALENLRRQVLPRFIRESTKERSEFLTDLFCRATVLQVLQLDSSAAALFAENMPPTTLFLDTNVVFRMLGLQGEALEEASMDILSLGREHGHRFILSQKTYQELYRLVEAQMKWLEEGAEIPESLSGIAADYVAGNDYVSSYWATRARTGISAKTYRARFTNLKLRLENLGIEVGDEGEEGIEDRPEFRTGVFDLRTFKPHDSSEVVEHDVYNKVLVESLRIRSAGAQPGGWLDAGYLFLTFDNNLPRLAAYAARGSRGHRVPFCVMAGEWLQVQYFLRPESSIDSDIFVRLLNSPYLQEYFSSRAVDRDIVREMAVIFEELGEYRPEVARKVYADRTLMNALETAKADEKRREKLVTEAIKGSQAQYEDQLEIEKKHHAQTAEALREVQAEHSSSVDQYSSELKEEKKRREKLEIELSQMRSDVANLESSLSAALTESVPKPSAAEGELNWGWILPASLFLAFIGIGRAFATKFMDPLALSSWFFAVLLPFLFLVRSSHFRTGIAVVGNLAALLALLFQLFPQVLPKLGEFLSRLGQ